MAVTNFSPLLGLALPTTGDLAGTWGATVNDSITQLLDSAVAGTTTLSTDADVTLSTTNGASNQARNAVILWTASNGATTRNITAPAQSKAYLVINSGTGSVVLRGAGPTTGVTVPASARALVAWNGADFVKVASNPVVLTTDVSGILPIANGGTGTTSTTFVNLATNVTNTLPVANGGSGQSTYTDGQLLIGNTAGSLSKATITAGSNISVTNGNGSITITATGLSTGDVVGPVSAVDSSLAAFDGTTGKLIKNATLTANNVLLGNGTGAPQVVAPGTSGNVLTSNGTTWSSTAPAVTLAGAQTLTNKTIEAGTFTNGYTEEIFALGTSGSLALNPVNGSIQTCALTGNPTFTDSLAAGQSLILMLTNGASYTVTFPTITWVTAYGNVPIVLTAADTLVFWKISTTLYGAVVGSYA